MNKKQKEKKKKWAETLLNFRIKHHSGKDIMLKKKYKSTCPFCKLKFEAKPSMIMLRYCINYGEFECPNCTKRIGLKIDQKNDEMLTFKLDTKDIKKITKIPKACFKKIKTNEKN